ncbi:hypothetical protein EXIGLDRAFT_739755 [Exidia glandulosa HHB12029]|uniref:CNH domain-containing protein n=1 Tax=Exidia glandulosa HHB12029 TaxID=1314781 RepID=A0A165JVA6_EXIGL|nr:hypothetical protein EXIGLDRAFT_739755 [Exidia glandulosa HHB12029]
MPPFTVNAVVENFKERPEAITVQGDHLYVGTSTGNLHIYSLDEHPEDETRTVAHLVEVKKSFTGRARPIDRLGFLRDINSLVVLCDWIVTLFPLPNLSPGKPLVQARNAMSFAINSSVITTDDIKSVVTHLLVGCQKKAVLYTWRDGEAQEVKEWSLPHSPRAIAFVNAKQAYMAYTAADIVLLSLDTLQITDVEFPTSNAPPSNVVAGVANNMGMGALANLGGFSNYMTLGLGAKAKPSLVKLNDGEILITREHASLFFGPDSKLSRLSGVEWPSSPDEIAYVQNYLFSILPGSPNPSVQIRSSLSLQPAQNLAYPFASQQQAPSTMRLLTTVAAGKAPVLVVSTPNEKNAATTQGSTLWLMGMRPWSAQLDELVAGGHYADALALLETLDKSSLPDQDERRRHIRGLLGVSYFERGEFDFAIDIFIELEVNPARVVALYPPNIAGRLSTPREKWIELFGGTPPVAPQPTSETKEDVEQPRQSVIAGRLKGGLDMFLPSSSTFGNLAAAATKDSDAQSVTSSVDAPKPAVDNSKRSMETLMRYLTDRRQKVTGALSALHISASQSSTYPLLSQTAIEEVFGLPDEHPSALVPEQLVRYAQVVYTAMFKTYLVIRPTLVGPLCRIDNWCEVAEVEEELRAREMFTDLIDLYRGKNMHDKALELLKERSTHETDPRDKLDPTIRYLQKLGPQETQTIFAWSRWLFDVDSRMALDVFTLEESRLPRASVADFLETIDASLCTRYIEHLINELRENDATFHDRLADLYLHGVTRASAAGRQDEKNQVYSKLLAFIGSSTQYHVDRLFAHLPSEDLYEAKAILLGRLGRHEAALEIYVYKLQNYVEAEEYCKRVYRADATAAGIFILLLRIFLRPPSGSGGSALLKPALEFISRQSPRLDTQETIKLLPPLVPAGALKEFLIDAVRQPVFDTRVVREVGKARSEEVARRLVAQQERRVRIDDSRICPQCHKRIGVSVIAVHLPRGEVTHYHCRETFSKRLRDGIRS